jgi:hypothetical protein
MCYDVLTTSSEEDGVKERSASVQKMPGRKGKRGRRQRESSSGSHIGVKVFVEEPWGSIGNNEKVSGSFNEEDVGRAFTQSVQLYIVNAAVAV